MFASVLSLLLSIAAAGPAVAAPVPRLTNMPGKHASSQTIRLSADVKCTPAQSYAMWTEADKIERFFAPRADIGGKPGDLYTISFFPADDPQGRVYGTNGARVLAAVPDHFLAFEWVVFAGDKAKGEHAPPYAPPTMRLPPHLPTWVELSFTPAGAGTRVDFSHFGFGRGALWDQSKSWFTQAWTGVLARMTEVCAKP